MGLNSGYRTHLVVKPYSLMQWCLVVLAGNVNQGVVLQQGPHEIQPTILNNLVEWSPARVVLCISVGTLVEQFHHRFNFAQTTRYVEEGLAFFILFFITYKSLKKKVLFKLN